MFTLEIISIDTHFNLPSLGGGGVTTRKGKPGPLVEGDSRSDCQAIVKGSWSQNRPMVILFYFLDSCRRILGSQTI